MHTELVEGLEAHWQGGLLMCLQRTVARLRGGNQGEGEGVRSC